MSRPEHEDAATRAVEAAEHLTRLSARIVAAVDELAVLVDAAVEADAFRRAALGQLGAYDRRPPVAAWIVELVHGRLGSLRPYLPHVSADAAELATRALTVNVTKE